MGAVGNVGNGVLSPDTRANAIRIVAFVGDDDGSLLQAVEQRLGTADIVDLTRRDQEADRAAFCDAGYEAKAGGDDPQGTWAGSFLECDGGCQHGIGPWALGGPHHIFTTVL
jgi:hypothetical protein